MICLVLSKSQPLVFTRFYFLSDFDHPIPSNGKETVRALFPNDAIVSALLAASPAGILTVMLFFTPQLYGEGGLACASRSGCFLNFRLFSLGIKFCSFITLNLKLYTKLILCFKGSKKRLTASNNTGTCSSMCKYGEDYRLADYYYIKSFCFGTMEDWDINETTGELIDGQEQVSLVRFKLYPYVLFGCAVLGKPFMIYLFAFIRLPRGRTFS